MDKTTLSRAGRILPAALLGVVLLRAAWERFRLPLTPIADPDAWVYLTPALSKLLGEGFKHVYGQCFLYPASLYTVLEMTGDFRCITGWQNVLGLGTGVLLYGSWQEVRRCLPSPRMPRVIFDLVGVALAAFYLLSTASIGFERALRPEAIFPFFVALHVFCNLRFLRHRFLQPAPRAACLWGGGAVFFSVAAFLLKPSFSGSLFLANVPVVVSLFLPGQSHREKLALVGWPLLAAGLLLLGPEWKLRQGDREADLFVSRSLFSIHADFIDEQMAADLAENAAGPFPREFVVRAHAALSQSLREARGRAGEHWTTLGFNADYLVYGDETHPAFAGWMYHQFADHGVAFYRYYYGRAVRHRAGRLAAKVGRQLGKFYRWGNCPAYSMDERLDLATEYRRTAEVMDGDTHLRPFPPRERMEAAVAALGQTPFWVGPFNATSVAARWLAAGYLPGLVGCGGLLIAVAGWAGWRARYGRGAAVLALLYAYNFGTVLTLALSHSLDVGRYSRYQLAYTLLPEAIFFWLAVEVALGALARCRGFFLLGWRRLSDPWRTRPPARPGALGWPERASLEKGIGAMCVSSRYDATTAAAVGQFLVQACAEKPADLLVGYDGAHCSRAAGWVGRLLRYVFGWSPRDVFAGTGLCSRRFCPKNPPPEPLDESGRAVQLLMRALAGGYSVREVDLSAFGRTKLGTVPKPRASARPLCTVLAGCLRLRPVVTALGISGVALCVAGLSLSGSSWRQAQKKRSHYKLRKVLAAPAALGAGLLCIEAGAVLGAMPMRQRRG